MNWEAVGAVGEVRGSVLVLVTLLYLARQVRETKLAIRSSVLQARSDQRVSFALSALNSEAMVQFFAIATPADHPHISLQDTIRYRQYLHGAHAGLENVYKQREAGQIDDQTYRANAVAVATAMNTNLARRLWPQLKIAFDANYQVWVEEILDETEPAIIVDDDLVQNLLSNGCSD